ncbi:helix-turn-helix domain-containing protein [Chitinophagaceae bacterium MMS25-I14]
MFTSYTPAPLLQPFVKAYRIIESGEELVNRVLPGTSPAIGFRFRGSTGYITDNGRTELPAATFSGLRKTVRLINYLPNSATLIVLFKEGGTPAFFREPLHELFEESISLDNFFSRSETAAIEEQLSEAKNNQQRIAILEQFLLSKLYNPKPDALVTSAIENIHAAKGVLHVGKLADSLYISRDAFEKRFRRAAGTTPKQFASIVRMNAAIRSRKKDQPVFDLALESGYYDQPHFNKAFRQFTGQSPVAFFRSATFW